MGKVRKLVNIGIGLAILVGITYYSYSFASAETRIRKICSRIGPGMTISTLHNFAEMNGLNAPRQNSGINFLVEKKTFGRWGCRVVLDTGVVQSAEYNFAD